MRPAIKDRSMDIVIRPYEEMDFEPVTTVWFASWESIGLDLELPSIRGELRERLPREIANGWCVHVAIAAGEIVGFLALSGNRLQQLFVAPAVQGQGVGKALLNFVKARRPNGFWLITPTQGRAVRFYEREGLKRGETAKHPKFGHEVVRYDWHP